MTKFVVLLLVFLLLVVALSHGKRFRRRRWYEDLLEEPKRARFFDFEDRHVKYRRKYSNNSDRNVLAVTVPLAKVVTVSQGPAARVVEALAVPKGVTTPTSPAPIPTAKLVTVNYKQSPSALSAIQNELNKRGLYMSDGALIATIIGSAIGFALLIAIVCGIVIFCLCCRKSKKNSWVPTFQKETGPTPWLARGGQKTS